MRILLAHKFWKLTGGADVFFRETERVLREAGHETLLVATGSPDENDPENLVLFDAPAYDTGSSLNKLLNLPEAIYSRKKRVGLQELIRQFKPDVVHIFAVNVHLSLSIIDAAEAENVPVVATFNDYKHICPNYKLFAQGEICFACKGGKFYNCAIKSCAKDSRALSIASTVEAYVHQTMGLYKKIKHFTFSSDFLAETTLDFWSDRDISWSKLLNPFDSAKYVAQDTYEPFGLYFGRIIDEKGVDRIIDAAGDIDGFPIKIIGNGPDEELLRNVAETRGLTNIEFLGPMWGSDLDAILSKASFVIVPSIWHENFPYVINQAFAFGRPVIGSMRGGITELVDDGTRGLTFDPDQPKSLANAIKKLISDPNALRAMGANAKTYSDNLFNDETSLKNLLTAYEKALS